MLQDLQTQQRQTHQDFERLKERNQELWRQVGSLRKKHDKQQDTVNRLISFMIHFIQQTPVRILNSLTPFFCLINKNDPLNDFLCDFISHKKITSIRFLLN